jgi:transposase
VITDPIEMNEHFVKLPDVVVLGVDDRPEGPFRVHVECVAVPRGCRQCGVVAHVKDRSPVELIDLPLYGYPTRLVWHKRRWYCPEPSCSVGSWTEEDPRIAAPRLALTDRAGRWVTLQVGRYGRSVNEVATTLGCDWHTVNEAVLAYGTALIEHPGRFGEVEALGLDEVLFVREGPYRRQHFSTQIDDVERGQLLHVVPGRRGEHPPRRGWRVKASSGATRSATPRLISRVPTGPSLTPCCPTPSTRPIDFTW